MFIRKLFETDPMEKDSSPRDLYKGVTEDSMFQAFKLDIEHHQM